MSISFSQVPSPTPPPPPPHSGQEVNLQVQKQSSLGEVDIAVKKGNWIDISKTPTDFPDSDAPNGLTMICLENALIDRYAQYAQEKGISFDPNNAGDREHALKIMKQGIHNIHGHLLKQGETADSPIIAETYKKKETVWRHESQGALQARIQEKKARGEAVTFEEKLGFTQKNKQEEIEKTYYKFHMTWEINLVLPDGSKDTLSKTQWVKTGISLPKPVIHPGITAQTQHAALLAVKAHRHVHKAAFNPRHPQYNIVKEKIEYLKCHDIISAENINSGNMQSANQRSFGLSETEPAHYTKIRLGDQKLHILHHQEGRKLNDTFTKWEKTTPPSQKNPQQGVTTQGYKLYTQAASMILRDPEIQALDKEDDLPFNELTQRYKTPPLSSSSILESSNSSSSISPLGDPQDRPALSLLDRIKRDEELLDIMKDKFDTEESQLRAGLLEMASKGMAEQGFTGQLAAFGINAAALFAEGEIVKKLSEQISGQFQTQFKNWDENHSGSFGELWQAYQSTHPIHEQVVKLSTTVQEIEQLEKRIDSLRQLHKKEAVEGHRNLSQDTKEMLLSHLEASTGQEVVQPSREVNSRREKITIFQSMLDIKGSLEAVKAHKDYLQAGLR